MWACASRSAPAPEQARMTKPPAGIGIVDRIGTRADVGDAAADPLGDTPGIRGVFNDDFDALGG